MWTWGMDEELVYAILDGQEVDHLGLKTMLAGAEWAGRIGLFLLWLAAALTLVTGWDYFRKAVPHLKG